ncbi:MAG: glycosyltransferase [Frankiales bacterium]|nr:glycosyltransferase [Frankiales bacterium]
MTTQAPSPLEVCIVAYRNEDTIEALIESLRRVPDATVAVHDNGPGAGTLDVAARAARDAGIPFRGEECPDGNCGFGAGCNRLVASSAATDVLFLNPDARVEHWPPGLAARSRIVGALVQSPDGTPTHVWGTARRLRDEMRLRWLRQQPQAPTGTGYVSGAAMLVGRECFNELGGFDEGFFMYYEDIDLCTRANEHGVPVVLDPAWVVRHEGGHSVGGSAEALTRAHLTSYASGRRYHAKRGHPRGYDALVLADSAARTVAFRLSSKRHPDAVANAAVARAASRSLISRTRAEH